MTESDYGGLFPKEYLAQYWPEEPSNAAAWADNAVLMLAYQEAGLAAEKWLGSQPARLLDVSTGPALAPLLGIISIVSEAQLSDYSAENRECLEHLPIDHWRQYVPMLVRLFPRPEQQSEEILAKLDALRKKPAVHVDLFQDPPFPDSIDASTYDLVSMNFVADSITSTKDEYFRCLKRATDLVRPGAALIMSAIVDSQGWEVTSGNKPSPNVGEEEILQFLTAQGFSILSLARSMRLAGLSYSGGWITLAAGRAR